MTDKKQLLIIGTDEVVDAMTAEEASSITTQIAVKLDAIVDNYTAVLPMIREAITREAHLALGYPNPAVYIRDRFKKAFANLQPAQRQMFVGELSNLGMSTRAIAPIVDVSQRTVVTDRQVSSGYSPDEDTPLSQEECEAIDRGDQPLDEDKVDTRDPRLRGSPPEAILVNRTGQPVGPGATVIDISSRPKSVPTPPPPPIGGLDGKSYPRPTPSPPKERKRRARPLPDFARGAGHELRKSASRIQSVIDNPRFKVNEEQISMLIRHDLVYAKKLIEVALEKLPPIKVAEWPAVPEATR